MAEFNGEQNRDDREEIEYRDDPAWSTRLRQDLNAALTPGEQEFRSRRSHIMAQIRAEAANGSSSATPAKPLAAGGSASAAPAPININRNANERRNRFSFNRLPMWAGSLAAAVVLLLIAGAVLLFAVNTNPKTDTGSVAQEVRATASAGTAGKASTNSSAASSLSAPEANPAPASVAAAAGGAAASALSTPSGQAALNAGATTAASGAANRDASTAPAPAMAASATTAAATTAAAGATTAAAGSTFASSQASLPLPLYNNAVRLNIEKPDQLRAFLLQQAGANLPPAVNPQQQGLQPATINAYNFEGGKARNVKLEDVVAFYQGEAQRQGYKVEDVTTLQNDASLNVRWLYLSKGNERLGVLLVQVNDDAAGNNVAGPGLLSKGDTGIFFATS
ncbi:MAG TPA: hypothetical protein VH186_15940 [Chloroflexia bacterium]|nr:hypothetical protein [Chloroflexia bacterium]